MPIKTNQEKATEDTHKRIKKKVKKIKKRIRKNATLTPQVARNTRGDANKYAPYPQFAYRPVIMKDYVHQNLKLIYQNYSIKEMQQLRENKNLKQLRDRSYKRNYKLNMMNKYRSSHMINTRKMNYTNINVHYWK